jgi:hypothetical protein
MSGGVSKRKIQMGIIKSLASSQNRRDDNPNQALAVKTIKSKRADWVKELIDNLENSDRNIQSDCIKVLYEIGERGSAALIAPYYNEFGKLLANRNNRLVWGAMAALDAITDISPEGIFGLLPQIRKAIDEGSVITVDHGVSILARLAGIDKYAKKVFPLLLIQLNRCPAKQLPMYSEKSLIAINASNKRRFLRLLEERFSELENSFQKRRIEKVIKKIESVA